MVEGPSPVAVGLDGLDDGMLGGGPGSKACPVAHLVLHRGEERLGRGVVVAVAGAAARQAHVVGAHPLASVLWCIGSSYRCRIWRFQPRICATSADSSAAIAMSADVGGHAVREQPPTTMRVHRSTTATRKSQPSPVRRYVMSPTSL